MAEAKPDVNPFVELYVPEALGLGANGCISFVNSYFNTNSTCYDTEKQLTDSLTSESLDNAGVKCDWYVVDNSLYNERIFGEDNDRRIRKVFVCKLYFDLPNDDRRYSKFGIEGTDVFSVKVGKTAWAHYAKAGYEDGYEPQLGDVFRPNANGIFYEVISVKDTDVQFLNSQHSWIMTVKVWENPLMKYVEDMGEEMTQTLDSENAIVDDSPAALTSIKTYSDNGSDSLKQNELIDKENEDVLFTGNDGRKKDDPFNVNW